MARGISQIAGFLLCHDEIFAAYNDLFVHTANDALFDNLRPSSSRSSSAIIIADCEQLSTQSVPHPANQPPLL